MWGMEGTWYDSFTPGPTGVAYNNKAYWPLHYKDSSGIVHNAADAAIGGSYSGRTLAGKFYVPLVQPGMRIMVWDGINQLFAATMTVMKLGTRTSDPSSSPYADIYTSLTVDVDAGELTVAEQNLITGNSLLTLLVPAREDVFVWTIQQGAPAVLLRDADGCSLVGLDIGGTTTDVSEIYTYSATPTWRSVGETVGSAAISSMLYPTRVHKRDYTRSFLTPAGKLDLVRLVDCRSRSPVRYGLLSGFQASERRGI
jgi:hypothetical protein